MVDVNAYLDQRGLGDVEALIRRRAIGAWFLDHRDRPLQASLPLFPPDIEQEMSFCEGAERLAVTFTFPTTAEEELDLQNVNICQTVVRCRALLTPEAAGLMISAKIDGGEVGRLLRRLSGHARNFETAEISRGSLAALEHLDIDFAARVGGCAPEAYAQLSGSRLLRTMAHMLDRHAGRLLVGCSAWSELMTAKEDHEVASFACEVRLSHSKPDPSTWKVLERLIRKPTEGQERIEVIHALQALKGILCDEGLSYAQRHCFVSSFIRRIRNALPQAYYEVAQAEHANQAGQMKGSFQHEPLFHVSRPLQRYIDVLGMRALKHRLGWRHESPHLRLSKTELEKSVATVNARQAAEGFGLHIFRIISWMRELSIGRRISDPLIGAVGPVYINVLIPSPTASVLEFKVCASALCGAGNSWRYDPASQSLRRELKNSASHMSFEA